MEPSNYSYHNTDCTIDTDSVKQAIKNYNKLKDEGKSAWFGMRVGEGNKLQMEAKEVGCWEVIQRFFGFGRLDWDFKEVSNCLSTCISNDVIDKKTVVKLELQISQSIQKHEGKPIESLFRNIFPTTSIEIPLKTEFAYKGSNAEYLLLNKEGEACSLEEHKMALFATEQRFPRPSSKMKDMSKEALENLQENEAQQIEAQVNDIGLTPVKIPKTLYDLFYWRFHLEDRQTGDIRDEDIQKVNDTAKKKFEEGRTSSPTPPSKKTCPNHFYTYDKESKTRLCINVPCIDFQISGKHRDKYAPLDGGRLTSYGSFVEHRYTKREAQETYNQVSCDLNARIIAYLKTNGVDPTNLSWENMRKISSLLLNDIHDISENTSSKDATDFDRKYRSHRERIDHGILGAIYHEYCAPPNVYTIYRSSRAHLDNLPESDKAYSFSFGHSPLGGIQYDGASGSPISYAYADICAVDIDIADYEQGGTAAKVVYIPPARGINRIIETGEIGHVRSRVKLTSPDEKIFGFGAGPGAASPQSLEFLSSPANTKEEATKHNRAVRAHIAAGRVILVAEHTHL